MEKELTSWEKARLEEDNRRQLMENSINNWLSTTMNANDILYNFVTSLAGFITGASRGSDYYDNGLYSNMTPDGESYNEDKWADDLFLAKEEHLDLFQKGIQRLKTYWGLGDLQSYNQLHTQFKEYLQNNNITLKTTYDFGRYLLQNKIFQETAADILTRYDG